MRAVPTVPGVGENEAAALVKLAKIRPFLLGRAHDGILFDLLADLGRIGHIFLVRGCFDHVRRLTDSITGG